MREYGRPIAQLGQPGLQPRLHRPRPGDLGAHELHLGRGQPHRHQVVRFQIDRPVRGVTLAGQRRNLPQPAELLDAAAGRSRHVHPHRGGERGVVGQVDVSALGVCAHADRHRLRRRSARRVRQPPKVDRRQTAVSGHQVAQRVFLSQRQLPAAVDHDLRVERGQAMDEAAAVLAAGRHGLRRQPGVGRLEGALLVEGGHADFLRLVKEEASLKGQILEAAIDVGHFAEFEVHGLLGQRPLRLDPLRT